MQPALSASSIRAVLLDIEGTILPIRFVHETMFGYARAALDQFLTSDAARAPEIATALAAIAAERPGLAVADAIRSLIDADEKFGPLKLLQGRIWADGFRTGALRSAFYPDVPPALRAWAMVGLTLAIYSSGSIEAQRLLVAHGLDGDLTGLFAGFFDTGTGPKRDAASYRRIATTLNNPVAAMLFLSDHQAELDAAAEAGMQTCQIVRPQDGTQPSVLHQQAASLDQVTLLFGLNA